MTKLRDNEVFLTKVCKTNDPSDLAHLDQRIILSKNNSNYTHPKKKTTTRNFILKLKCNIFILQLSYPSLKILSLTQYNWQMWDQHSLVPCILTPVWSFSWLSISLSRSTDQCLKLNHLNAFFKSIRSLYESMQNLWFLLQDLFSPQEQTCNLNSLCKSQPDNLTWNIYGL